MKVSKEQYKKLFNLMKKWEVAGPLDHLEIDYDVDMHDGVYIGLWTGGETGKGIYLGIERDGHTHS